MWRSLNDGNATTGVSCRVPCVRIRRKTRYCIHFGRFANPSMFAAMALTPSELQRTPLYGEHLRLRAKLIAFGGWEMPVYYTSILEEHQAVRAAAGLFDISHMGQFRVRGPAALGFLNRVLTNDVAKLKTGLGQ